MHHYTECGLDYVYLTNGYTTHKTPYGEGISIENFRDLHKLIGTTISTSPSPIQPQELRFLRVEMDISQKALAQLIQVDAQTIARWEKGETKEGIPGPAERLIRALYLYHAYGDADIMKICERLAELDQHEPVEKREFEDIDGEWHIAA